MVRRMETQYGVQRALSPMPLPFVDPSIAGLVVQSAIFSKVTKDLTIIAK